MNEVKLKLSINLEEAASKLQAFFGGLTAKMEKPIQAKIETGQGLYNAQGEFKKFSSQVQETTDKLQGANEKLKSVDSASIGVEGSIMRSGSAFEKVATHLVAVNQGLELFQKFFSMFGEKIEAAATLEVLRENFKGTEEELENFSRAAAGTVGKASLIKLSNQMTSLGLNMQQQTILFAMAEKAADAMGVGFEEAVAKVINASEGASKGLTQLGISKTKFNELVKQYAKEEGDTLQNLDSETQQRIRLKAIIESGNITYNDAINNQADVKDRLEQTQVVLKSLGTQIGEVLLPYISGLAGSITNLLKSVKEVPSSVKIIIFALTTMIALGLTLNSSMGKWPYLISGIISLLLLFADSVKNGNGGMIIMSGIIIGLAGAYLYTTIQINAASTAIMTNLIPSVYKFFASLGPVSWAIIAISALSAGILALSNSTKNLAKDEQGNADNLVKANKTQQESIKLQQEKLKAEDDLIDRSLKLKKEIDNVVLSTNERTKKEKELNNTLINLAETHPGLISAQDGLKISSQKLLDIRNENIKKESQYRDELLKTETEMRKLMNMKFWADYNVKVDDILDVTKQGHFFGLYKTDTDVTSVTKGLYNGSIEDRVKFAQKLSAMDNKQLSDLAGKNVLPDMANKFRSMALDISSFLLGKLKENIEEGSASKLSSGKSKTDNKDSKAVQQSEYDKIIEKYEYQKSINELNRKDNEDNITSTLRLLELIDQTNLSLKEQTQINEKIVDLRKQINDAAMSARISYDLQNKEFNTKLMFDNGRIEGLPENNSEKQKNYLHSFTEEEKKQLDILNQISQAYGVTLTAKVNTFIQTATAGLLNLSDISVAIKEGYSNAANGLAQAGSQSIRIFKQANSVLQQFLTTLIRTVAQVLIYKGVMALLSIIPGLKEGGAVQAKATGGVISGPGTETSDSIPALLSNGEYVVNAKATKKYKGLLDLLNFGNVNKYALGGVVGGAGFSINIASANMSGLEKRMDKLTELFSNLPSQFNFVQKGQDLVNVLAVNQNKKTRIF